MRSHERSKRPRRNGDNAMTIILHRIFGIDLEPDPDFDDAANEALARSRDQLHRLAILEQRVRTHTQTSNRRSGRRG